MFCLQSSASFSNLPGRAAYGNVLIFLGTTALSRRGRCLPLWQSGPLRLPTPPQPTNAARSGRQTHLVVSAMFPR